MEERNFDGASRATEINQLNTSFPHHTGVFVLRTMIKINIPNTDVVLAVEVEAALDPLADRSDVLDDVLNLLVDLLTTGVSLRSARISSSSCLS